MEVSEKVSQQREIRIGHWYTSRSSAVRDEDRVPFAKAPKAIRGSPVCAEHVRR